MQFRGRLAEDGRGIGQCCEFEGRGREDGVKGVWTRRLVCRMSM